MAVLGLFGVPGRMGFDALRVDLRIDLRPEKVGSLELNVLDLFVVVIVGVAGASLTEVDRVGVDAVSVGRGGKGLLRAAL